MIIFSAFSNVLYFSVMESYSLRMVGVNMFWLLIFNLFLVAVTLTSRDGFPPMPVFLLSTGSQQKPRSLMTGFLSFELDGLYQQQALLLITCCCELVRQGTVSR